MTSLLPPNANSQELAMEAATARIADVPVPLRDLWNADTCPEYLLPWLAWALSLDAWDSSWPEAVKREQIRMALEIQRRKGTLSAVRSVVESFGGSLAVREWWDKGADEVPHTFEITMALGSGVPATSEYQQSVVNEVRRVKPVRSQFSLVAGVSAAGRIGLGAFIRSAVYRQLRLREAPFQGGLGVQGALRPATYVRLDLTGV